MPWAIRLAAPRAVFAMPPRSLVAAMTGAACGVQIVAASAFSPRTSTVLPVPAATLAPHLAKYICAHPKKAARISSQAG
ncbi:MAG TPA: hypothetical protein VK586_12955 [Streptosporangiaceae bacterium]|nr:hypothetical protein [Streptosporangiaceae bacterium]